MSRFGSLVRPWFEAERRIRIQHGQDYDYSVRWLGAFEAKSLSYISDADLKRFHEEIRTLRKAKKGQRGTVRRAVFGFYTALLERGQVEDVGQNLTPDTRDSKVPGDYCFDAVLKLVAKRDPETLDLHQPLVQQLLRFSPFSRQGPELPRLVAREVIDRLPEDIIGKVPQRRAALRIWISDEERRLRLASIPDPSRCEWFSLLKGVPDDRSFPLSLAEAFGGRGRARYTALLVQNLAPRCEHIWFFNKLCDQWNHVPSAKDVVLALQATELKKVERCGLVFFDQSSIDDIQGTINRIPAETARQQVRDVVASALINKTTTPVEVDSLCAIFNHQRTLGDVSRSVSGQVDRHAMQVKDSSGSMPVPL